MKKLDIDGVIVLNKPKGFTSVACLNKLKRRFKLKKIGHAGTLDPIAQGVLIVLLGQATKLAPYLAEGKKTYRGKFTIGLETDTFDKDGKIISTYSWEHISEDIIRAEVEGWVKWKEQLVPPYAAVKYKGRPFYSLAREGKDVPVVIKPVKIYKVEVLDIRLPDVEFRVECSKGTYVRSLVHVTGKKLGCGAIVTELTREESFPYNISQAVSLDEILEDFEIFKEKIIPLEDALPHWPKLFLNKKQSEAIKQGKWLDFNEIPSPYKEEGIKAIGLDYEKKPIALLETKYKNGKMYWSILRGLWKK